MAKLKKTLQDIQMPAVQSTKTSIVKKRRNRRKKKTNVELLNNIDKNNLKKSSVSNEIAKDTFTNMQNSEKKESYSFKNKLNTKYVKNIDVPTKYPKDNKNNLKKLNTSKNKLAKYTENSSASIKYLKSNKNNIKKLSVSNDKAKDVFPNWQKSKMKKSYDSKNKFDAKCTENSDILIKYPKHDKKRISNMSQEIQINSNVKVKCKKNKKRKQDMNLNRTNKNAVRVNDEDDENNEDNSSEDDKDKSFTKREEKLKKLQMELKNLKFKMTKLIEENKDNMKQMSTNVDAQQIRPNILKLNKHKININRLKEMLENKSQIKKVAQSTLRNKKDTLRDRMKIQLRASRFRFINETLYNNDSSQSKHYFQKEPDSFMAYHAGYKQQIEQWLINPLDVIISSIKELPEDNVIADFGCGEARLAVSVPQQVHSFDFIALNDKVKACDMAHTPLLMNSVHVVVFCLSLMGSNLNDYIIEANRVLKNNGILKIAEVESRFEDVKDFIRLLRHYGFKNTWKDLSHNLFYFMDFKKKEDISMKRKNLPSITLKSCVYKKR